MPPTKPGPDPDQTPLSLPVLRSAKVWETGVAPNDTRIPGTRRLWLAGALALAVVSSCVTAITLQSSKPDDSSEKNGRTTAADDRVLPAVSLPPESPLATSAPDDKSGLSEPQGSEGDSKNDGKGKGSTSGDKEDSDSSKNQQGGAEPTSKPSKTPTKKPPSSSTTTRKSVRSATYPDRYWHLRDGALYLDQVSSGSGGETKEDSSFKVVSGLANSSCYSFRMADGRYVRHQNFVLRAAGNDGSQLFMKDATFCPRSGYSGSVLLESVNYPGHFVRHRNFQLRLERAENNGYFYADATFSLVKGFS
ncbi:AbfB domain-containing protein [Streptomyces europaeiscabiei]|uniref:AbfB domain-containing protein n=1 Tax=Streptomyces europaeiscabiei TaxID=146819 RepID=UPI0029AEAEAC|nr:AbfB domain-containing protein [Streptomyces europaeiscabiei]MDX3844168.1 AbfB domain-containing protein [Streptomyces europaeiscabiei]MDX3859278.1 AbfB domain-containing protein [Streptomyces europaeiscabiei]MDX3868396.1 AbfB domain-containing protein [Streptomyces europaeiscabiei]